MKRLSIISLVSIIVDRIIKLLILSLGLGNSITVINGFFNITCIYNYGAAWNILTGQRIFLIIITLLELFLIYYIFLRHNKIDKKESLIFGLLIGGILGNLIDRIVYGYVIDYLDFNIFGYNYPVFNLADSLIVISVILLIIDVIRGDIRDSR